MKKLTRSRNAKNAKHQHDLFLQVLRVRYGRIGYPKQMEFEQEEEMEDGKTKHRLRILVRPNDLDIVYTLAGVLGLIVSVHTWRGFDDEDRLNVSII